MRPTVSDWHFFVDDVGRHERTFDRFKMASKGEEEVRGRFLEGWHAMEVAADKWKCRRRS